MPKRALGKFAKANIEAARRAEMFAGLSLLQIEEDFMVEDDDLGIDNLSMERYLSELESTATDADARQEFNEKLARLYAQALEEVNSGPEA